MSVTDLNTYRPTPPNHVAIIMDGNGRWARARGLPRTAGHRKGAESVRHTLEIAADLGVNYLTLFAFSSENWSRPKGEVTDLMGLLKQYLKNELQTLHKNNIRFQMIGDCAGFSNDIIALIKKAEETTAQNTALNLVIALNYGARAEITQAAQKLAQAAAAGILDPATIDQNMLASKLFTANIPDPDLIIRTSGEKRISNFLLWQAAYAEFVFSDKYWPDFQKQDFMDACTEFNSRERRYGDVKVGT